MAQYRSKPVIVEAIQTMAECMIGDQRVPKGAWIVHSASEDSGIGIYSNDNFGAAFESVHKQRIRTAKPTATRGRPVGSKNKPKTEETKET